MLATNRQLDPLCRRGELLVDDAEALSEGRDARQPLCAGLDQLDPQLCWRVRDVHALEPRTRDAAPPIYLGGRNGSHKLDFRRPQVID